jgi:hypothetical protein
LSIVASKFDHVLPQLKAESKHMPLEHDSFMDYALPSDKFPEIYAKFLKYAENYPNFLQF